MADFVIGEGRILEDYNFFADLLSTFRSLNDWIKALIIVGFYASITACILGFIQRKPKKENSGPNTSNVKQATESGKMRTIDVFPDARKIASRQASFYREE